MPHGYMGKILRVNLTTGKTSEEVPDEKILRSYLGGSGLGIKYLSDELPLNAKPLDKENPLIITTGPLTGTSAPAANNMTITCLNAEVDGMVASSHTHGYFGPNLKWAGYDGIIVTGASKKPVYLWIHDGQVEIRDAAKLWGADTHETEDLVKQELGEKKASVAAIGPAGENMIGGACVENDKHHTCATGGTGAVMGSKKLKAIAVLGSKKPSLAKPAEFQAVAKRWRAPEYVKLMGGHNVVAQGGMPRNWYMLGDNAVLAGKNLSSPEWSKELGHKCVEAWKSFRITPKPCWGCPVGCPYEAEPTSGPHKGEVFTLSGGGENLEGSGAMIGVTDPASIMWLCDRYDRLGFGTSTVGCTISLAFECYERGILTKEDTGGLELNWGNAEAASTLLDMIVARKGIGKILGEGPKKAAEAIGKGAWKYAVHIKGAGYNLHDWRGKWVALFGQIIAQKGPAWEHIPMDVFGPEPDLGYTGFTPFTIEGVPEAVRKAQLMKLYEDSMGCCFFAVQGSMKGIQSIMAEAISAATGWDLTVRDLTEIGERIANVERVFSIRRGHNLERELDVGARLLEPPADGLAKGQTIAPYLRDAILEYYQLMGWDKTGKPLPETLTRLGLKELVKYIS